MPACSRCGSQHPNSSCYVCAVPEKEEPDAFHLSKEDALERLLDELAQRDRHDDPNFITER